MQTIHGPLGYLLHRLRTGIQTHDDAIKNEQDRLHHQYKAAGIPGIDAMTLARQATLHPELSNAMMHANLLALMKHLGYVPYQAR
jgi:hypothetical protein